MFGRPRPRTNINENLNNFTQINTSSNNMTQSNIDLSFMMLNSDDALNKAAVEGRIYLLQELIKRDPYVLYRSSPSTAATDSTGTSLSALHTACKIGHSSFVSELLRHRPDLSEEVDPSSSSTALHIACRTGNLEMVRCLISANPKACFIRDRQGKNPVHIAAERGDCEILRELIEVSPDAARDRVGDAATGDTVMHLCVKYNKLDALKLLVEKVGDVMVLNAKDADGNTVLHLAVIRGRLEMTKLFLGDTRINKNVSNSDGLTPMDIHNSQEEAADHVTDKELKRESQQEAADHVTDKELKSESKRGQALPASELIKNQKPTPMDTHNSQQEAADHVTDEELKSELKLAQTLPASELIKNQNPKYFGQWIEEERSSLMIVASLIAAVAFQGCFNPPGGVWQDNYGVTKNRDLVTGYNREPTPSPNDVVHIAGTAIAAYNNPYHFNNFLNFNSIGLASSTISLLLLISGLPWKRITVVVVMVMMWIALASMIGAYLTAMVVLTLIPPTHDLTNGSENIYVLHVRSTARNQVTVGLLACLGVILIVHIILWTMKLARKLRSNSLELKN